MQSTLTFCTIVDRLLTDACNKDLIVLVQLRGTFSTKNNAMNTHFLHIRRKKNQMHAYEMSYKCQLYPTHTVAT
jgi:hypothetical protein